MHVRVFDDPACKWNMEPRTWCNIRAEFILVGRAFEPETVIQHDVIGTLLILVEQPRLALPVQICDVRPL
jgi:hypothetical protein